ncbi:MAG: PAS domain S-box protein [Dehalococcoidia bacterium]|jgi:PAS domain S-box-containing protein/putative nucleotidyltransferase with HDIG domain
MKALVVDDNPINLNLFKVILERKGFEVITAANGEDALQKLHNDHVDIIVSDILMPIMDGFHLLQECKSNAKLQDIPFAFVTGAFLDAKDEELALKLGVQAFIRKPVEPDNFARTLEEILVRKPAPKKRGRPPKERKNGDAEKLVSVNLMQKLEAKMTDLEEEIIERKRIEEALRNSEEQYRLLFETMAQGALYYDAEGAIISANPAAERILGLSKDRMLGMTVYDSSWRYIREDGTDLPGDMHPAILALKTGKTVQDVVIGAFNPVDNMFHWTNISAEPQFKESEDRPYRVFTTFDDITDRFLSYKAIQESESRITAIMENTRDSIWSVDDSLHLITANNAARDLFLTAYGVDLREGAEIFAGIPEESRKSWVDIAKQGLQGQHFAFERHYDLENGPVDLQISVNPIVSPSGQITGVSCFGRDMTQQNKAEKALEESEERYRVLINNAAEEIYVVQNGQVKFTKPGVSRITGYSSREIMSKTLAEIVVPDDLAKLLEKHAVRMAGGEAPAEYTYRVFDKSGNIRWVGAHVTTVLWEGRPASLMFQMDVTDRINLESALKESEIKYRTVVENAVELIVIVQNGKITFTNRRTSERLGYTWDELFSRSFLDFIHPDDRQMVGEKHTRRLKGENIENYAFRLLSKDGTVGWVEVRAVAIEWEGMPATLNFLNDITERKLAEDALQKSEEKYRLLVESANEGIHVLQDGIIKFTNPKFAEILGTTVEKLIGRRVRELIHPDDLGPAMERYHRRLQGESITGPYQLRYKADDSPVAWIEVSGVSITWENQPALLYFTSDITARKLAEDALRQSEEKYRSILQGMDEAYYEVDSKGNFTFFNEALGRLGYSQEELLGMNYKAYVAPEELSNTVAVFSDVFRTGNPRHWQPLTFIAKDGTKIYVEDSIYPLKNNKGEIIGLRGIIRDVTGRKQSEEALRLNEEKYRNILEEMDEIYYEIDLKGNFVFFNDALCRQLGYTREELKGLSYKQYTPPKDISHVRETFIEIYRTGRPVLWLPMINIRKDGSRVYVEDSVYPIKNNRGEVTGFRGISRDVTAQRKAQEQLKLRALLLDISTDSIVMHDFDGHFKYVNEAAYKSKGYTREELMAMKLDDLLVPEYLGQLEQRKKEIQDKGWAIFEGAQYRKDGSIINIEVNTRIIELEGEELLLSVEHDITQRKKAEAALQESEQRYRSLFEYNPVAVYLQDLNGAFISVNDATSKLTGYSKEEMLSMRPEQFIVVEDIKRTRAHFIKASGGESQHYEVTIITKSGEKRNLSVANLAVVVNNSIVGVYSVAEDVTERNTALERINSTLEGTIEAIAMMSELRDPYTAGHQKMVTQLAMAIAVEMGLSEEQIRALRVAGLLHDVGKVYVPSEILSKPGKLSELERGLAKTHASASYDIVKAIKFPWPVCRIIIQHHERLDGSGYPKGIKGDEIIPEARILAVADVVEAMTSHRPYRPALGIDKALEEITMHRGVLYDENVVDACVTLFKERGFKFPE